MKHWENYWYEVKIELTMTTYEKSFMAIVSIASMFKRCRKNEHQRDGSVFENRENRVLECLGESLFLDLQ